MFYSSSSSSPPFGILLLARLSFDYINIQHGPKMQAKILVRVLYCTAQNFVQGTIFNPT